MKDVLFFSLQFSLFQFLPLTGARKEKKRERRVFACLVGRFHKRKRRFFPFFQNYYHHTLHKAQTVTD